MFTLQVENKNNQFLTLTQNESDYQVVSVEGLNPPEAEIYTSAVANMDGAKFKSSKLQMRNLVLTIKINGNVEANRIHIYEYMATGKWCKIYYSNGSRNVFIEGYVETIECPLFTINQEMQISIVCPIPYLKSLQTIYADISKQFPNFEFPFDIEEEGREFSILDITREGLILNNGEISAGAIITLTAKSDGIINPIIYDVNTAEYISLDVTLNEGDILIINTNKGEKSIKKIVDGVETNAINSLVAGSTWLQLETGMNKFTYTADQNAEQLQVEFELNLLYEGV